MVISIKINRILFVKLFRSGNRCHPCAQHNTTAGVLKKCTKHRTYLPGTRNSCDCISLTNRSTSLECTWKSPPVTCGDCGVESQTSCLETRLQLAPCIEKCSAWCNHSSHKQHTNTHRSIVKFRVLINLMIQILVSILIADQLDRIRRCTVVIGPGPVSGP